MTSLTCVWDLALPLCQFDAEYTKWTGAEKPALTVVPVPALPGGHLVSVEAVAAIL
jgi:enamine deaminase RidA (YjgF/YER057c/UK114 family)